MISRTQNRGGNSTQSGSANVAISAQLAIVTLHPASVYAGGLEGFTLQVDGSGFVPSSPGPGSTLLIGGTARVTNCTGAGICIAPVTGADVAQAGNLNIQVQNPNASTSNVIQLVVVQPSTVNDVITLTTSSPSATGMNITVVEPTTAGIDTVDDDLDLNIAAIGMYTTSTNTCSLGGNAIRFPSRPHRVRTPVRGQRRSSPTHPSLTMIVLACERCTPTRMTPCTSDQLQVG